MLSGASLRALQSIVVVLMWTTAVAGVLTTVATLASFYISRHVSMRESQLNSLEIAKANERVAQAHERATLLERDKVQMEYKLQELRMPRELSKDFREQFAKLMIPEASAFDGKISIGAAIDSESQRLGRSVVLLFRSCGVKLTNPIDDDNARPLIISAVFSDDFVIGYKPGDANTALAMKLGIILRQSGAPTTDWAPTDKAFDGEVQLVITPKHFSN